MSFWSSLKKHKWSGEYYSVQIFDRNKFIELLLYICKKSENDRCFGAIKLNKLLFFCDIWAYGLFGKSITGAAYKKRDNGPAPTALIPIKDELIQKNEAESIDVPYFDNIQHRLIAKREPDTSIFSLDEIGLIDEIIEVFKNKNASEVSEISHKHIGWQIVEKDEDIPYHTFFLSPRPLTEDDKKAGEKFARENNLMESCIKD